MLWQKHSPERITPRNQDTVSMLPCNCVIPQIIPAIDWLLAWYDSDLVTYQRWPVPAYQNHGHVEMSAAQSSAEPPATVAWQLSRASGKNDMDGHSWKHSHMQAASNISSAQTGRTHVHVNSAVNEHMD